MKILLQNSVIQVELEVTLPGEGRDRVFKVAIKWLSQISLYTLEEALEGRARRIPECAVEALDVIMRHLPSMMLVQTIQHIQ